MITQSRLHELFSYEPETGSLVRRTKVRGPVPSRRAAGWRHSSGYLKVSIDGKSYQIHRLVWLYHHGVLPDLVDHINGDKADNRIENVRPATTSQNSRNRGATKSNPTGLKGVSFYRRTNTWRAQITANGKKYWLGVYETPQEAHEAYRRAAVKLHGDFACFD